jgi:ubiquitin-protein ligase
MTDTILSLCESYSITEPKTDGKILSFTYNSRECKIILPSKGNKYHVVEINDETTEYPWLDDVNLYCIRKKPDLETVIKQFMKHLEKESAAPKREIKMASSVDDFDVGKYRMKLNMQKLIPTSSSAFNVENSVKKIFDAGAVANIIIDEFIEVSRWAQATKLCTVELLDNNIYSWSIMFKNFTNKSLNKSLDTINSTYGYDSIQIQLHFHNVYYPMYPPMIKIVRPRLANSLMHRIANSKMVNTDYWSPVRNATFIIKRISHILNTWGVIIEDTDLNNPVKYPHGSFLKIEEQLLRLASFIDVKNDEIDKDEVFHKMTLAGSTVTPDTAKTKKSTTATGPWKSGTGYGMHNSVNWDPSEYIKIQEEKDKQISKIITNIIIDIQSTSSKDYFQVFNAIEHSLLIPYVTQQLKEANLLDMNKREELYMLYFNLLENIATEQSIYLFSVVYDDTKLYDVLTGMQDSALIAYKMDNTNRIASVIINLYEIFVDPLYKDYLAKLTEKISDKVDKTVEVCNDVKTNYVEKMKKHRFDMTEIYSTNFRKEYLAKYTASAAMNWSKCNKRLAGEIASLAERDSLPIHYDSAIFLRVDENKPMIMRALITGPAGTPYDSGCFIFDIYTSSNYPTSAPDVWFMNHGGFRLNPNLYADGKVCLSILGTYIGPAASSSEKWNATSTLSQVFISIQAQILIDLPWYNEPGREGEFGTARGKQSSDRYNDTIKYYTMKSTVCDLLESPHSYPQYTDVILEHFKLKKDYILTTYKKWCDEMKSDQKTQCDALYDKIKAKLDAL